ncbi:MAG: class I SAM-dependent methyltransferase [Gammaproteobacteria bacterium]
MNDHSADRAGLQYWEAGWSQAAFPVPFDPNDTSLNNHVNREFHRYFSRLLAGRKGLKFLEIGCANSVWPIYFSRHHGCEVCGLDYSETGCARSRKLLHDYQIAGTVYCADLFQPPPDLLSQFDLVVSFGVAEHFDSTPGCLRACAGFVRPGGLLVTVIPNLTGMTGMIQRWVDKQIYSIHVPMTKDRFRQAHEDAGLQVESCEYFMSISLGSVNSGKFTTHPLNRYLRRMLSWVSKACWFLERYGIRIPANRITSPYIMSVAPLS